MQVDIKFRKIALKKRLRSTFSRLALALSQTIPYFSVALSKRSTLRVSKMIFIT